MSTVKRCIIDTDGGVDDALALILALKSPELAIKAITVTAGNTSLKQAINNIYRILKLAGRLDIPIASGAEKPLHYPLSYDTQVHGKDGLGNLSQYNTPQHTKYEAIEAPYPLPSALDSLIENANDIDTLITLGPLTNLAQALEQSPNFLKTIPQIVIMGGAFRVPGNVTAKAEFNIWADPHAAAQVFKKAASILCIGLDVTTQVILPYERVIALTQAHPNPITQFIADTTHDYATFYEKTDHIKGFLLHDPLAVLAAIDESCIQTMPFAVEVETNGLFTRGMTVIDERLRKQTHSSSNTHIALKVDKDRALSMIEERLWQP